MYMNERKYKTMKCEKCGKEANFFYSSTVNGKHEEHCYCADCAKEAGFENAFHFQPMEMFDGFFDDFFAPMRVPSLFDGFGGALGRMMAPALPRFVIGEPQQPQRERSAMSEAETKVPEDAGADVKARREREALRHQLDEAVAAENFEKAIELRDQLRKLDA